jgi:tetratricopeptide (TPR) repeat protein
LEVLATLLVAFWLAQTPDDMAALAHAAEAAPRDARAWKALGAAYAAQGQYENALAPLRRACLLDASLENACYFEARALYALDRFEDSLQVLDYAVRAGGDSGEVRLGKAQALEALGRAASAEKEFHLAIDLSRPADTKATTAFGLFLIRRGRTEEAAAFLAKAVERSPASADTQMMLGRALLESGKASDAIPHLERAVALRPDFAQAHLLLAKAYVQTGRTHEAEAHFAKAAKE